VRSLILSCDCSCRSDRLTSAQIKNLVYTNVMMMDEYLPGIKAVIEGRATPEQATRLVEQGESIPSDESSTLEQSPVT
jgi:hypothetical protein